jgi:hypothetical protein
MKPTPNIIIAAKESTIALMVCCVLLSTTRQIQI